MEYLDREVHDDELVAAPSLAFVRKLANALGVTAYALLSEEGAGVPALRVSYVKTHLRDNNITLEVLRIVSAGPSVIFRQRMLTEYNVEFLQDLCAVLDIY